MSGAGIQRTARLHKSQPSHPSSNLSFSPIGRTGTLCRAGNGPAKMPPEGIPWAWAEHSG